MTTAPTGAHPPTRPPSPSTAGATAPSRSPSPPSGTNGQWAVTPGTTATINVTTSAGTSNTSKIAIASATPPTGAITGYQGLCLDDRGASTTDYNPIQVYTCNNTNAQQWTVESNGTLQVLGKCLDVNGGDTTNGTVVDLYDCNNTAAQTWTPQPNGSLVNPQSGKCLDRHQLRRLRHPGDHQRLHRPSQPALDPALKTQRPSPSQTRNFTMTNGPCPPRPRSAASIDCGLHSLSQFRVHPRIRVVERLALRTAALPDLPYRRPGDVVTSPARAVRQQDTGRGERGEVPRGRLVGDAGALGVSAAADPVAEGRVEQRIQPALGQPVMLRLAARSRPTWPRLR